VIDHLRAGGSFEIRKVFDSKGARSKVIMVIAHYPEFDELAEMVEEMYGGGCYSTHPAGSAKVLKKYTIDSPSRFLTGGPKQKSPREAIKDGFLQDAVTWLRTEADTETKDILIRAVIEKEFGIQLPPSPTVEEKQLKDALEEDPEFKRQFRQALLEKLGYEKEIEPGSIDQMISDSLKFKEIQELLGGRPSGGRELAKEAVPVLLEIVKAFTKGGSGGAAVETAQVPPAQQPVQAAPSPDTAVARAEEKVPLPSPRNPLSPAGGSPSPQFTTGSHCLVLLH